MHNVYRYKIHLFLIKVKLSLLLMFSSWALLSLTIYLSKQFFFHCWAIFPQIVKKNLKILHEFMYNRRDKRKYVNLVLELIKYLQSSFVPIYLLKEHSNKSNFDIQHVRTSFLHTYVRVYSQMFTYHRSCWYCIPFEPKCDKWWCYENNTGYEESCEIKWSITSKD